MNQEFYMTKEISENLDKKLLMLIHKIILKMKGEVDYLQVFKVEEGKLTHTQEVPVYRRIYPLSQKHESCTIFAIRTEEKDRSYWTLLYAHEY